MWIDELKRLTDAGAILTGDDTLREHSYDTWPVATKWRNQGKQPYRTDVAIRATSAEQIGRNLRWASQNRIPVTLRGLGSNVTGSPLSMRQGIVFHIASMNRSKSWTRRTCS
ncbi:MAG: FAD-binding protein [Anaerolineae bacterium]|nr:FAD-binding protein [Anaerolineae bacterium]